MPQGNLKPQSTRTKSEQREIARMGGKASVAARRHKRDLREHMTALLEAEKDGVTGMERLTIAMFRKALAGDMKAAELVLKSAGQTPRETVQFPSPLPRIESLRDIPKFINEILKLVTDGQLSLAEATQLADLATVHIRALPASGSNADCPVRQGLTPAEAMRQAILMAQQAASSGDG